MKITDLLGPLILAGMTIFFVKHTLETDTWSKSTATVERTELFKDLVPHGKDDRMEYRVTLYYTYQVDGTRYSGHSTTSGDFWKSSAESKVKNFPAGTTIKIIYNPQEPEHSEIKQPGWSGSFQL